MRVPRGLSVWIFVAFAPAACEDETAPALCSAIAAEAPGPKTFAELRSEVSVAACSRFARCGLLDPADEPRCAANLFHVLSADASYLDESIAAGRRAIDPAKAQTCVDSFESLACDASAWDALTGSHGATVLLASSVHAFGGSACEDAIVAQTEDGEACESSMECCVGRCDEATHQCTIVPEERAWFSCGPCAQGYACLQDDPGCWMFCAESCTRLATEGESCPSRAYCAGELRCIDGRCARPSPVGEPCGDDLDCEPGLHCRRELDANFGTCSERLSSGEPCSSAFACTDGLVCRGLQTPWVSLSGPGDPPPAAIALGVCASPAAAGSACAFDAGTYNFLALPGATGCFELSAVCDPTFTCAALPRLGEACAYDGYSPYGCDLLSGAECTSAGVCSPPTR